MFRIDRNLVNLATARSIQVEGEEKIAGAEGIPLDAAASPNFEEMEREALEAAQEAAQKIIADARNEAAALLLSAREQIDQERKQAWEESYAHGSNEGKRIAEEKYKNHYETKIREDDEMVKRVVDELYRERKATYDALENEVVALTLQIVRKILHPAEEAVGGVFESLIRNALRQMAPEGKIIIRVSPTEFERFFSSGTAFFELDKGVTVTASVLKDPSLGEYDVVIDTEDETVNAGIETQLKYIRIAFNRADDLV